MSKLTNILFHYVALFLALLDVILLFLLVTSLTCYECNSATDADRDACFAGNATEMTCTSYQDTCVIILTKILLPNNGPQDRKSDNEGK